MNKQSNIYTLLYVTVLVVVVGAALSFTALTLKPQQTDNANADKMKQILASVHITPENDQVITAFSKFITRQDVLDAAGQVIGHDAFAVDMAQQSKTPVDSRKLPLYFAKLDDGSTKYIIPMYGAGLWGPIWGYVAIESNGSTIYGAYFAHQGETPGLGAEIEKPTFCNQFSGKALFKDNVFRPIAVLKSGQTPTHGEDYVDAISGGTITSKGVEAMLDNCLTPYKIYFETLNSK